MLLLVVALFAASFDEEVAVGPVLFEEVEAAKFDAQEAPAPLRGLFSSPPGRWSRSLRCKNAVQCRMIAFRCAKVSGCTSMQYGLRSKSCAECRSPALPTRAYRLSLRNTRLRTSSDGTSAGGRPKALTIRRDAALCVKPSGDRDRCCFPSKKSIPVPAHSWFSHCPTPVRKSSWTGPLFTDRLSVLSVDLYAQR